MKKTIIILASIFSLVSCTDTNCPQLNQTLINNSGKDVKISAYKFIQKSYIFSQEFNLQNGGKIHVENNSCPPGVLTFSDLVKGDSIVIDYGDRIKSYRADISGKDIRNPYYLDFQNDTNDFIYKLTPEDYANAKPKQ